MTSLDTLIASFKNEQKLCRIAIFKSDTVANNHFYDILYKIFSKKNHVEIVDLFFLYSYEGLHNDTIDILIIPEVDSLLPVLCYRIEGFLRWGGAVIIAGNDMLMQKKNYEDVRKIRESNFNNVFSFEDDPHTYFRGTIGVLGIKPYIADIDPINVKFDTDFIQNVPQGMIKFDLYRDGAGCNTTSNVKTPFPFAGCAFPERYEVLRNYDIAVGYDGLGRKTNSAVTFAGNWETGARMCVFPSTGQNSFFDPANPYCESVLEGAVDFCKNKIIVNYVMPRYVCYREGEIPYIDYKIRSFHKNEEIFDAEITISADGKKIYFEKNTCRVEAKGEIAGTIVWDAGTFKYDIYEIEVKAVKNGKTLSKGVNAFVIWNADVIKKSIEIKNDGTFFNINNRKTVVLGTNYYESNTNAHMWVMPNIFKLNSDLKQMADFGINYIRIHYHHPKWFFDFWKQRYGEVPEIFNDLGNHYLPSEKYLRIFDAHIYLCQKYKIIYGGDLFTLIPEEMGDPRGWYGAVDFCTLESKLEAQKEFLRLLIPRYKDVPGISWDIINEPYINNDVDIQEKFHKVLSAWEAKIKAYMLELGEKHLITVGNDLSGLREIGSYTGAGDYLSPHGSSYWKEYKGPQIAQETYMDRPFTPEGEQSQLERMKKLIIDTFRKGMAGFAPWQWTGQLAMWQSIGTHHGENWDDMLGCCVRHDATVKPAGRFYRDFIRLFHGLNLITYEGNNRIEAKEGEIQFIDTDKVKNGDCYFSLRKEGDVVKGIAKSYYKGEKYSIETNVSDASVFFDFTEKGGVYIKADEACVIKIVLPEKVKKAYLTDGLMEEQIDVENSGEIKINILPWQTYYWFKLVY
jgi:hypothetical protein